MSPRTSAMSDFRSAEIPPVPYVSARVCGAKISGTSPAETAACSAGRYWSGVPKRRFSTLMLGLACWNLSISLGHSAFCSPYQVQSRTVAGLPPALLLPDEVLLLPH